MEATRSNSVQEHGATSENIINTNSAVEKIENNSINATNISEPIYTIPSQTNIQNAENTAFEAPSALETIEKSSKEMKITLAALSKAKESNRPRAMSVIEEQMADEFRKAEEAKQIELNGKREAEDAELKELMEFWKSGDLQSVQVSSMPIQTLFKPGLLERSVSKLDGAGRPGLLERSASKLDGGSKPAPLTRAPSKLNAPTSATAATVLPANVTAAFTAPAIPEFEKDFEVTVNPLSVVVSKIPESVLRERKEQMESALIEEREKMVNAIKSKEVDILWREQLARTRVGQLEDEARDRLHSEKMKFGSYLQRKETEMGRGFRRAREELTEGIRQQEGSIREKFGVYSVAEDQSQLSRRAIVYNNVFPQPVEARIHFLRAIKTKLPKGAYVLMLSQFDRLGGRPLRYGKIPCYGIGPGKPAVSRVVKHHGRYFDRVLTVEDSVFALCPPRSALKPSYILVFELFELQSARNPTGDRVVAWSALPMCNEHLAVVEGKFKLPFLRGEVSPEIEHFKTMEVVMSKDLNNWLCNGYIEIRYLGRDAVLSDSQKREMHVDFDFLSKQVQANTDSVKRTPKLSIQTDVENGISWPSDFGAESTNAKNIDGLFKRRQENQDPPSPTKESIGEDLKEKPKTGWKSWFTGAFKGNKTVSPYSPIRAANRVEFGKDMSVDVLERGYNSGDDYYLDDEQRGKLSAVESVADVGAREWATSGIDRSVKSDGKHAVVITRVENDGIRMGTEAMHADDEENEIALAKKEGWSVLKDPREIETYSMAIVSDPGARRKLLPSSIASSKLRYIYLELFGDFATHLIGSFDFWVTLLVTLMTFWLRMYVHFLGQYLFLQAIPTPVFNFGFQIYEMQFKYISSGISSQMEVLLVAIGHIANIVVFGLCALGGLAFYKIAGYLPESGSKFIASFGFMTILDPLLIFLIDLFVHNYDCGNAFPSCKNSYNEASCHCQNGDFVKLWYRMDSDEGSGLSGLIITLIIYFSLTLISFLLFYEYILRVHRDARVLDLWRRIDAPAEEFFIPHDFEITHEELLSICNKAKLWRGPNGASRRLIISEYVEKDPYDPSFREVTKHYAIYQYETTKSGGTRKTLYRHFLMLPDYAIIEIFEEFTVDLSQQSKALSKLLGESAQNNAGEASGAALANARLDIFKGLDSV